MMSELDGDGGDNSCLIDIEAGFGALADMQDTQDMYDTQDMFLKDAEDSLTN